MSSVALYRAYGIEGDLLYVGTSIAPDTRLADHRRQSEWWPQMSWYDVSWYASAREASEAERRAILDEHPAFNIVGVKTAYAPHWHACRRSPRPVAVTTALTYLSVTEVAARTGLTVNTVKTYSQIPGRLPAPDAIIGRVKGWLPETIDAWTTRRKVS